MQEVIDQIMQIDSRAFKDRSNSEEKIEEKRKMYESKMKAYEEEKLSEAQRQAEVLYGKTVEIGEEASKVELERSKQLALKIENKYLQVEAKLLEEVFAEFFVLE